MIHRINVFLLSLIIAFSPVYLMTTAQAATPKWVLEYIKAEKQVNEKKRLQAHLIKQINDSGTKKTINAVVETVPTASKVGSAMIKRIHSPLGVVGVATVTSLLNGIGWVMEEGTYVKKIPVENADPTYEHLCLNLSQVQTGEKLDSPNMCASRLLDENSSLISFSNCRRWSGDIYACTFEVKVTSSTTRQEDRQVSKRTPRTNPIDLATVPLTGALLGAAMMGEGYKDPDPNFDNDLVNTGGWTGVEDAYREDPSGIGNELNDELQDKADRAPRTSDGSPAPIGDPDYDRDLTGEGDDSNDRSWDEDGNEGKTENTEKTDPETGEKTTEGSFTLPKFCDWAFTVCEWYEDWQSSDQALHKHLDETSSHQSQEKSFWQTVKDWFDWTKEDTPLPEPDNEIPEIVPEIGQLDTSTFQAVAGCPAPIQIAASGPIQAFTISYEPICQFASKWSFVAPLIGFLSGAMIVIGVGRKGEDADV
ncbi:virulence factor TspB C-terminal domain-related protein [Acinetobacter indicus]|uniref:virulence factor TspB C-terminal domain-related protein n=1 Tax=Acinetobacter indicus TaxID=756892 RepID=UPI0025769D56|nr:virulence factor TspB C-terminal domain-related protein [Acinetobacter indicus]MDM1275003.1 hypothetical protein [Acinetobacter indicus]